MPQGLGSRSVVACRVAFCSQRVTAHRGSAAHLAKNKLLKLVRTQQRSCARNFWKEGVRRHFFPARSVWPLGAYHQAARCRGCLSPRGGAERCRGCLSPCSRAERRRGCLSPCSRAERRRGCLSPCSRAEHCRGCLSPCSRAPELGQAKRAVSRVRAQHRAMMSVRSAWHGALERGTWQHKHSGI